jgi:S-adenosylmethionine synthetase
MSKNGRHLFTSESVTEGHPDKICDQISDAVLDAIVANDPAARVACECSVTTGLVFLFGEITTSCYVNIPDISRNVIRSIGYDKPEYGFDGSSCCVITSIDEQSPDIALGVNQSFESRSSGSDPLDLIGAGDQGMMFGYACKETPEFMPAPITFSHQLTKKLADVRKTGMLPWLRPDGKAQTTVQYGSDGSIERVHTVVVSAQHDPDVSAGDLRSGIMDAVILPTLASLIDSDTKIYINPTGRFVTGGPVGDSGLTGRKIIADTYGGRAAHGGGSFSGKDPTKVDRSASYMARYAAKNIVAAGLASECEIELAYAIGVAHPVSVFVDTRGTGIIPDSRLSDIAREVFDFRPGAIIETLGLRRPIYLQTAAYGHFGRPELDLPWERTDRVRDLRSAANI